MGRLFTLLLLGLLLVVASLETAWSANLPSGIDFEFNGGQEVPTQVRETPEHTDITLNNEVTFRVLKNPPPEIMRQALNMELPEDVKNQLIFRGQELPKYVNPLEAYESLPAHEKETFEKRRVWVLNKAAKVLWSSRFLHTQSIGTVSGNIISFIKQKVTGRTNQLTQQQQEIEKIRELRSIQDTLKGINYRLYNQAKLVVHLNEFSIVAGIGGIAEQGVGTHGKGGLYESLITLGFNFENKTLAFQIIRNPERFKDSMMAASLAGVILKAGVSFSSVDVHDPIKTYNGKSFYPPMAPGFQMENSHMYVFGASTTFGWPPLGADAITFSNTHKMQIVTRVSISPFIRGFVNYEGAGKETVQKVWMKVSDAYYKYNEKFLAVQGRSCHRVFN